MEPSTLYKVTLRVHLQIQVMLVLGSKEGQKENEISC